MNIVINELTGIVLKTKDKVCEEDIVVTLDESVKYKGEPGYTVYMRNGFSNTTSALKNNVPIKINGSGEMTIAKSSIPVLFNQDNTYFMLYGVKTLTFVGIPTYYTYVYFYKQGTTTHFDGLEDFVIAPNGTEVKVTILGNVVVRIDHSTEPPMHSGGSDA